MDLITYATLQVVIDAQAWLSAINAVGGDAPEEKFKAAVLQFKEETARLIGEQVETITAQIEAQQEEE